MFAWFLDESPGSYRWGEVADPPVGPTDVRVRVVASGLNHIDHWLTQGLPSPKSFPHVPGADAAGIIDRVGSDVDGWSVGDEVVVNCAITTAAAIDELGVDSVLARGLQLLGEHRWGGHGEFVVVPAGGARADHRDRWRCLGRSPGDCAPPGWRGRRHVARPRQVRPCHRTRRIGGAPLRRSLRRRGRPGDRLDRSGELRPGGRFVTCGGTSGRSIEVNLPKLFFKQHELIGSTLASQEEFATVTGWVRDGLDIVIDDVVDLADYPRAVERVRRGQQFGKLVVRHES